MKSLVTFNSFETHNFAINPSKAAPKMGVTFDFDSPAQGLKGLLLPYPVCVYLLGQ